MKNSNGSKKLKPYDHSKIEKKWQREWAKKKTFKTEDFSKKEKFYVLDMFPYPSGEGLHVGHPKGYIATDIVSRMKRMQGHNVLHPMGFDAFGLPAEQYAIKTKTNPEIAVKKNVARYKKQLEILGMDYDWSREVNTTDPKFYKWTQWIFLKLLEKGLAYESNEPVNWCPVDKTVLSNEDVENGHCERCGALVEKRAIRQWVLKITDYADRLLADLDATDYVMPKLIDKVNPHVPGAPLVKRNVAHAIVYDPKNKKYLIIRNKKFGWDTVIIGGIEGNESIEETARREVREETGYTDLEFKRILGGPTEAQYYTKHKGENRVAIAQAAYFELKSDKRVALAEGEDKDNEILWIDEVDFVPGKMVNSELPIWLERLGVEVYFDKRNPDVPCFKDVGSVSAYRPGAEEVERDGVVVIVKHWKEDKFIALQWKKVNWRTFVTGGIEKGQTPEEAAVRELQEETGYKNIKSIKKLGIYDAAFFHPPKGVNRYGHYHAMYIELKDGKRDNLTEEENSNHVVNWVNREEVGSFITTIAQKYAWNVLFLGQKTHYRELAKPLLDWPESIKESQRNWIGRSEGMLFTAPVRDTDLTLQTFSAHFEAFAADTFVVIAPDHPFLKELVRGTKDEKKVLAFADDLVKERSAAGYELKESKGIFTGRYIIDPVGSGDLPIWVANYALADYGTGIVKCSAHDERDFAFAKKYNIPLKAVLFPRDIGLAEKVKNFEVCYSDMKNGILHEPKEFNGKKGSEARQGIIEYLIKNKLAEKKVSYRLRDWVFSRQRYWGEPIPVIHDGDKVIPLSEKDLPLTLPKVKSYEPTGTAESPLANVKNWVNVKVGKGKDAHMARRETNTMPQWAGSSWYYLRYMDPKNNKALVDQKKEKYWNSVDLYVGGAEHATRHLIYARFWHKFLYDIGVVDYLEPFHKLQNVGLIMGPDGRKMSKRFGNVINPDDIVTTYGADTLRLYEMFMGPFDQAIPWSTESIVGVRRFLERVWKLQEKVGTTEETFSGRVRTFGGSESSEVLGPSSSKPPSKEVSSIVLHQTIKKVSEDIESLHFNTCISALMILANEFEKQEIILQSDFEAFIKLLSPFAPHIAEEIWRSCGGTKSIALEPWPAFDPAKLVADTVTIVVQVNSKVRGQVVVASGASENEILEKVKDEESVKKWLTGEPKKVIYVPNRLINIVI